MARTLGKIFANAGGPPDGWFVAPPPTGSATGDGSFLSPWTLQVAMDGGYPTGNEVQPGDTVWLRGGTYNGQFECRLVGTPGNWIKFIGYPGERVIIDGAQSPGSPEESGIYAWYMHNWGEYQWLQDVEVKNSNTLRYSMTANTTRTSGILISAPHSKVINCISHDGNQAIFPAGDAGGPDFEVYGCLLYHSGSECRIGQANGGAAIDLLPAAGNPVDLSGSYSTGSAQSPTDVTISHNNTGDYTVLVAAGTFVSSYTTMTATYDDVEMTRINGANGGGNNSVAVFGIAGHAGTHDVVVHCSETGKWVRCIVQSFVNVHQTVSATAEGTWESTQTDFPPYTAAATSDTNHMVVDGCAFYGGGDKQFAVSGDNTLIALTVGGNPGAGMSYAAGAASVDMSWTWIPPWFGHGHNMYLQENVGGKLISDNIFYDAFGYAVQIYGSSGAGFVNSEFTGNIIATDSAYWGGLGGFDMTDSVASDNYFWGSGLNIGYSMQNMSNFTMLRNYVHDAAVTVNPAYWYDMVIGSPGNENTFVGTTGGFDSSDFPDNDYYTLASPPTTNVVVVRPNAHEANRANIVVYNWEDLDNVSVDLSSAVAVGTPIYIMNAQDYFADPVWSGTYSGGTVSLPMDGLTEATWIGDDHEGPIVPQGPTGRAFNCFIVRAQAREPWR